MVGLLRVKRDQDTFYYPLVSVLESLFLSNSMRLQFLWTSLLFIVMSEILLNKRNNWNDFYLNKSS